MTLHASRRERRPSILRWVIWLVVLVVVFGLGVALGQVLENRPPPAEPITRTSDVRPWTQTQP